MEFATITPCRYGERQELVSFCKHQIERMTVKPAKSYFVSYKTSKFPDLVERIQEGCKRARSDGFDFVFILENDDFFPLDYFENRIPTDEDCFIGDDKSTYYNLRNNTWRTFDHPNRSSLYNTGFNLSCIKYFDWPNTNTVFLDILMWEFANKKKLNTRFIPSKSIGIKHGLGQVGGRGHVMVGTNKDENREWLKSQIDTDSWAFYQSLKLA